MANYTIKNLKRDVEDMAPQFGLEEIEARFARDILDCQNFGLSYQRLEPNARNSFGHRHNEQEEVYVILDGGGRVKLDDDIRDVTPSGRGACGAADDPLLRGRPGRPDRARLRRAEDGGPGRRNDP